METIKKHKKLSKKQRDWLYGNIGLGMLIIAVMVILIMTISIMVVKSNKPQYFYGKDNMNYHGRYCYERDGKFYCLHETEVNWFYKENEHE